MRVVWKRYIALVLAICLVISCGMFSSDHFLRATDGQDTVESTEGEILETTETEDVGEVVTIEQGTYTGDTESTELEEIQNNTEASESTEAEEATEAETTTELVGATEQDEFDYEDGIAAVSAEDEGIATIDDGPQILGYTSVEVGDAITLTADRFSNNTAGSWNVDDGNVASIKKNGSTCTVTGKKAGTVNITYTYTYSEGWWLWEKKYTETATKTITVKPDSGVYPVAVYATSGSKEGVSPEMENLLGLGYKQADGYYPIGVIYLDKKLFKGKKSPYITNDATFKAVMDSFTAIDTSKLISDGRLNDNNKVADNLDKVQKDINKSSGSQKTALFDWLGGEVYGAISLVDGQDYKYHLDLRFNTKNVTYVISEKNNKETEVAKKVYLTGTSISQPTSDEEASWIGNTIPAGYDVAGYYTDKKYKNQYKFGEKISEDTKIYIKLKESKITVKAQSTVITYDGKAHNTASLEATEFTIAGKKYTVEGLTASVSGTAIDAGDYNINVSGTPSVKDENGKDVTKRFKVEISDTGAKLTIKKRKVTLTSASYSQQYNGKYIYKNNPETDITVGDDGFAEGEGASYTITGKQKLVGSSSNTFTYKLNSNTKAGNYEITKTEGSLSICDRDAKYQLEIVGNSGEAKYDGELHEVNGFKVTTETSASNSTVIGDANSFTMDGVTYKVSGLTAKAAGTDYKEGGYQTVFTYAEGGIKIIDSENDDVTSQFLVNVKAGYLTINKRNVTLTSESASKPYDGKPLTNNKVTASADGFVAGQGVDCKVTGTVTLANTSVANEFTYDFKANTKADNYIITKVEGTLSVTGRSELAKYSITVEAKSGSYTYDGKAKTVEGLKTTSFRTRNGVTYTVEGLTAGVTARDAGSYTSSVTGTAIVRDANGNDVTDQFHVYTRAGQLKIGKRIVSLTSGSSVKYYDGKALTNDKVYVIGSFVEGQEPTYNVTGSILLAGFARNSFTYSFPEGVSADNYTIVKVEGLLTVLSRGGILAPKYEITVKANSATKLYDGQAVTAQGFETSTFTVNGEQYTVSGIEASATATNAGTYPVNITGCPTVKDASGNDVTNQFKIKLESGLITINKRNVILTSATRTEEYTGSALIDTNIIVSGDGFAPGEGASYEVSGSQKLVGSSDNSFTYTLNEGTNADNYIINAVAGTITIINRNAKYSVTVEAIGGYYKYDGLEKSAGGLKQTTFTIDGNTYYVTGLTAGASAVNAGSYSVNVVGEPVVKDADGNDVTEQFVVLTKNAVLSIAKRNVIITSASAFKTYDGNPLTVVGVEVTEDGFAEGEGAKYTFTGSQTLVGYSANTFTYELVDADERNYDISLVPGTLTVNSRGSEDSPLYEITLVPNSDTVIYDGTEHKVEDFETTTFEFDGNTYTVTGIDVSATGTKAGVYDAVVSGRAIVRDAKGNDVTEQFKITIAKKSLTIKGVHNLTINYVDQLGNKLAASYTASVVVGEKFGPISSPEIEGYIPTYSSVSSDENGMPDQDITIDVVYNEVKTEAQPTASANKSDKTNNSASNDEDNQDDQAGQVNQDDQGQDDQGQDAGAIETGMVTDTASDEDTTSPAGQVSVDENGNGVITEIDDQSTPQSAKKDDNTKSWALLNLIAMILTIILSIVVLLTAILAKKKSNKKLLKLLAIIPAVAAVVAFVLTENMKLNMAMTDSWTLLMVIILIVDLLLAVLSSETKEEKQE